MAGAEAKMEALRQRFLTRARDDHALIAAALQSGDRSHLSQLAHGLAGIAAIFGYAEVSAVAGALEENLDEGASDDAIDELAGALLAALGKVGPVE